MPSILDDVAKKAFPSIFQDGKKLRDAVSIYVGGSKYDAWKAVRINRSLEQLTGSFAITMADRWRIDGSSWPLKPGEQCLIKIGDKQVINGYIDQINVSVQAESRTLEIIGRDKTGDLVDSSALDSTGSGEFKNITVDVLAKKFATELFGIPVKTLVPVGNPFEKISIKPGESIFQLLERAAKLRGLLLLSDGEGNLVITNRAGGDVGAAPSLGSAKVAKDVFNRPSVKNLKASFDFTKSLNLTKSPIDLVQGQNILEAEASYDYTERFQTYLVKGQAGGTDVFNRRAVSQVEATAKDFAIKRGGRVKVLVADGSIDTAAAQKRANWEAIVRATKAADVTIKTQGWLRPDGSIWTINELVQVDCSMIGLKSLMLVTNVTFSKSPSQGSITALKLSRPDSYSSDKNEISLDNDPTQNLGWGEVGIGGLINTLTGAFKPNG